jgi:histidinol-phosphate aminotransferase
VLKTCSKIGFAAARLGFAVANPSLTGYLRAAKSPYNVNSLTQIAGEELLSDPDYLDGAVKQITASRDALYSALSALEKKYQKIEVFATHTNFVAVRSKYAAKLHKSLRDGGVSVRLLGGELLRITAGSAEENVQVLSLLERSLAEIV